MFDRDEQILSQRAQAHTPPSLSLLHVPTGLREHRDGCGGWASQEEARVSLGPATTPATPCSTVPSNLHTSLKEDGSVLSLPLPGSMQHGSFFLPNPTGCFRPWHSWLQFCWAGARGLECGCGTLQVPTCHSCSSLLFTLASSPISFLWWFPWWILDIKLLRTEPCFVKHYAHW